jgi:hypothetical protein
MHMKNNRAGEKRPMTQKQKQAAVVCAVCALAVLVTASITGVLVSKKIKAGTLSESEIAQEDGYNGSAYVLDSSAVLAQTADGGDDYLSETLFLGDSNTVRLYKNGLITVQQFCAKEGLGIQDAATEKIVSFKGDSTLYTIPDAVAKMKPRRVVITLGTNNGDGTMSTEDFISDYRALISAIQTSYSYTDIIVNAIPPVPAKHSSYPDMDQAAIDAYNIALAKLCEEMNCKFLNSAETLKDDTGYGKSEYYVENDIHLTQSGLKALISYVTTHVYDSEDRRPDTDNIPQRTENSISTSSKVTVTATATPTASAYTATYIVDSQVGGGTLSCGNDSGATSLKYDVKDSSTSFTVTAVPNSGYVFVKWSDGQTSATRTDKNFKQNLNVTAVFSAASVKISGSTSVASGVSTTLSVSVSGGSADNVVWYLNGEKAGTGSSYTFQQENTSANNTTYTVKAALTDGVSDSVTITVLPAATPTPSPTPSPTPTQAPVVTPSPTPEVTASPTPAETATGEGTQTTTG